MSKESVYVEQRTDCDDFGRRVKELVSKAMELRPTNDHDF